MQTIDESNDEYLLLAETSEERAKEIIGLQIVKGFEITSFPKSFGVYFRRTDVQVHVVDETFTINNSFQKNSDGGHEFNRIIRVCFSYKLYSVMYYNPIARHFRARFRFESCVYEYDGLEDYGKCRIVPAEFVGFPSTFTYTNPAGEQSEYIAVFGEYIRNEDPVRFDSTAL